MKNQSKYVWSYAAYGGEPQYIQTPYGMVKNDAAYKNIWLKKEWARMLIWEYLP